MSRGINSALSEYVDEHRALDSILLGESGYTTLPFTAELSVDRELRSTGNRVTLRYITPTQRWAVSGYLNTLHLLSSKARVADAYRDFLLGLVQSIAPLVYELDPRIGLARTERYKFGRFPAFDRPDGRTEIRDTIGNLMCSMCDREFSLDENFWVIDPLGKFPVWSGGNFLWTHPSCHQKIYGAPQT